MTAPRGTLRSAAALLLIGAGCSRSGDPAAGSRVFAGYCSSCHVTPADPTREQATAIAPLIAGRDEARLFEEIGRLEELDPSMPPFAGGERERIDLAAFLAELAKTPRVP